MNDVAPAPVVSTNGSSSLSIALALSGGGFRATMFHLGVIRFLADHGLLTRVQHICAVSGGSILAAHVGLNWGSYCAGGQSFDEASRSLLSIVEKGVREKVVLRMAPYWLLSSVLIPIRWIGGWFTDRASRNNYIGPWGATDLLETVYSTHLYQKQPLTAIGNASPGIHILATNLTIPTRAFCFMAGGCESHPGVSGVSPRYGPGALPVAAAVAASSAFPGLFPPFELSHTDVAARQDQFGGSRIYLTDGGVFDNLALQTVSELDKEYNLYLISGTAGVRVAAGAGCRPPGGFG